MPANLYRALGEAAGCHAFATAFYAHVAKDPILRPFFPSTFTCAIEEFSAFLVQFLGGEAEATQRRWWLSLRESHSRFPLGQRERDAWMRAMTATLQDESIIGDSAARKELLEFFTHSSAYVVNRDPTPALPPPLHGELAPLWNEQLALDTAIALLRNPNKSEECINLLRSPMLQQRFARSPAVHASVLALVMKSQISRLREHAVTQITANPALARERYRGKRTLLHDACAAGDVGLVEHLLDLDPAENTNDDTVRSPLYCVANECSAFGATQIVRALLKRDPASVNVAYGVKRCTPLHMAARRGNTDVIGALLDGGADIEARDSAMETPLRRAVNCNKVEAARLLLKRGANPHSRGSESLTPAKAARSAQMKHLFGNVE